MIAIIDYGVGNIFSLCSSLKYIGADAILTSDPREIELADKMILPGVGAFKDASLKLKSSGLYEVVKNQAVNGKPLLGICLGMQLLFEKSFEYGEYEGIGLIKGEVVPIVDQIPKTYKIPHIGWNSLKFPDGREKNQLFKYVDDGEFVYFVHSYYASNCNESLIAVTEYGIELTAAVANGNVYGVQFHPEKSGETGMKILKAFCEIKE